MTRRACAGEKLRKPVFVYLGRYGCAWCEKPIRHRAREQGALHVVRLADGAASRIRYTVAK